MDFSIQQSNEAVQAAERGDWDHALRAARNVPLSWDVYQQFPSASRAVGGMPDHVVHAVLDRLGKRAGESSFVHEYAHNAHPNASPELLARMWQTVGGGYERSMLEDHPNWGKVEVDPGIAVVAQLWNDYEHGVKADHFAAIKHYNEGPALGGKDPWHLVDDHRGGSGTSATYANAIPHIGAYAAKSQKSLLDYFTGFTPDSDPYAPDGHGSRILMLGRGKQRQPHVLLYRGVGGNYGKAIVTGAGLGQWSDNDFNHQVKSEVTVPMSEMASWTISPEVAHSFALARGSIEGQPDGHGAVLARWTPLSDVLHCGMVSIFPGQKHAHDSEYEVVVNHRSERLHLPRESIVARQDRRYRQSTLEPEYSCSPTFSGRRASNQDLMLKRPPKAVKRPFVEPPNPESTGTE